MSELRALIRELLAEEIAALRAELLGGGTVERVSVASEAELTDFACQVARRARAEPGYLDALEAGQIRYAPALPQLPATAALPAHSPPAPRPAPAQAPAPALHLVASQPAGVPEIRKGLITERDIAGIAEGTPRLRVVKAARLTPLASDEARRRGIRIERTLA